MAGAANTDLAALVEAWAASFYDELDFELEGQQQSYFRQEILTHTTRCYVPEVSTVWVAQPKVVVVNCRHCLMHGHCICAAHFCLGIPPS